MFSLDASQMGNWVAKVWLKKVMTEAGEGGQVGNCFLHKVNDSVVMRVLEEVRLWWQAPPILVLAQERQQNDGIENDRIYSPASLTKLGSSRFREILNQKDKAGGNGERHGHQSLYTCSHVCTHVCVYQSMYMDTQQTQESGSLFDFN